MSQNTVVPAEDDEWFSALVVVLTAEEHDNESIACKGEMLVLPEDAAHNGEEYPLPESFERVSYTFWNSAAVDGQLPTGFLFDWEQDSERTARGAERNAWVLEGLVTNEWRGSISVSINTNTSVREEYGLSMDSWDL